MHRSTLALLASNAGNGHSELGVPERRIWVAHFAQQMRAAGRRTPGDVHHSNAAFHGHNHRPGKRCESSARPGGFSAAAA